MFSRYFKFHLYSMIAICGTLLFIVLLNIFAKSTGWQAVNIAIKAFALITLFESLLYYYKIMRVLEKIVDNITKKQVVIGLISQTLIPIGISFFGLNFTAFAVPFCIGLILHLSFKINQINRILPHLCMELDGEIENFNQELE